MRLFDKILLRIKGKNKITDVPLKEYEIKTEHAKVEWGEPKYIICFSNEKEPFVPYCHIEGQEECIKAPSNGAFYYDPIEDCPEFREIDSVVEQMVYKELGDCKNLMG